MNKRDSELDPAAPPAHGRFIDPAIGLLMGEASQQQTKETLELALQTPSDVPPTTYPVAPEGPSYYNQPVIQEPVWIWTIPAYFYVGGTAGAALVLGATAQRVDGVALRGLMTRCRWVGTAGILLSSGLLIADLGRPSRFLNMLRVFRPSSPLNVGSWLLALGGAFAGGSALFARSSGFLRTAGDIAAHISALFGMPLAGYTGVVLADTAVPIWQQARRSLPAAFVGSAMASTASLMEMMELTPKERRVVKRFAIAGKAAELAGTFAIDRETSRVARVNRPLKRGLPGTLWKAAKILSGASLLMSILPGRSRQKRIAGGLMGTAGALCVRFAVVKAGKKSAHDPHATFMQQRAGYGAAEATGFAALAGSGRRAISVQELERPREEERPKVMTGGGRG